MVAQAFVDDSGGKGTTRHFVLAALCGDSESWAEFSNEWRNCLAEKPVVRPVFKMKDAAGLSGAFWRWDPKDRDEKLRRLCGIINSRPRLFTYSMIDLEAHAKTWALMPGDPPSKDPYFWPYQNTIMAICHHLWDIGHRERFEIIYDVQMISGPKARIWYPAIQRLMEIKYPEQAQLLPVDPMFKTDDEFLPLQAADLFAWCSRNATDKQEEQFGWLLKEMPNLRGSEYSQYYDLERMQAVTDEAYRLAKEKTVPRDLVDLFAATRAQAKKKKRAGKIGSVLI